MSIIKQTREEELIRKAKYRVKNADGKYELVYLETSADQVEETADRVFVTPAEKAKITSMTSDLEAEVTARTEADSLLSGRLDTLEGVGEGSVNKALVDAKAYADTKAGEVTDAYKLADTATLTSAKEYADGQVKVAKEALEASITEVSGKVTTNEEEITKLKDVISNKNSNTIVVNTEAEIATANSNPKVGDLAFVITSKRAYIYNGVTVLAAGVPEGWVVFDEITSEVDLVDYLKKEEAERTYRKSADKIAEVDLATELAEKINGKADQSFVTSEIGTLTQRIADEENNRQTQDGLLDGKITSLSGTVTELQGKVNENYTAVNNKIDKNVTAVSSLEPVGTAEGHVWLEILN